MSICGGYTRSDNAARSEAADVYGGTAVHYVTSVRFYAAAEGVHAARAAAAAAARESVVGQ
jgi:hypothetical protein